MVLVFLSIMNYLIDAYTIYAASVLAANSVLRSLFGAGFPLFTTQMYGNLGIHWASSIPAFLALMCVPFPFLFYRYGEKIRRKCKFAREAAEEFEKMMASEEDEEEDVFEKKPEGEAPTAAKDPMTESDESEKERDMDRYSEKERNVDRDVEKGEV